MRRITRYIGLAVAGITIIVLSALVALILFSRTARFNRLVQARLAPILATTFRGEITIDSVQGSIWGNLELRNVRLHYAGAEIVRVPRAFIGYALIPLLWRSIHLTVEVDDPVVTLIRDRSGRWNLLEALASSHPARGAAPSTFAVVLDSLMLHGGATTISPAGADGSRYTLSALDYDGALALGPSSTDG